MDTRQIRSAIAPTGHMLDIALRNGEQVLLEGAQGAMLDIDQGTYPFVTSSVTSRANASHGAGIHPGHIGPCLAVTKALRPRLKRSISDRNTSRRPIRPASRKSRP